MHPPIHAVLSADTSVTSLLGVGTAMRLFPFGQAKRANLTYPYAVWQVIYGQPENSLSCRADMDSFGVQIDVYAKTWRKAREVADAIRYAIELDAYVTAFNGEMIEPETETFRVSFTTEWLTPRSV